MNNAKKMGPGQIVIIQGGKYHGQGARVCKVNPGTGKAQVIIAGKLVTLGLERLGA